MPERKRYVPTKHRVGKRALNVCIWQLCGVSASEKWAVSETKDKKGFSNQTNYFVQSEEVQLRMESFHQRCRQHISVYIKNLKSAMQCVHSPLTVAAPLFGYLTTIMSAASRSNCWLKAVVTL